MEEEGGSTPEYSRRHPRKINIRTLDENAIYKTEIRFPHFSGKHVRNIELRDQLPLIWDSVYHSATISATIYFEDGTTEQTDVDAQYVVRGGSGEESN